MNEAFTISSPVGRLGVSIDNEQLIGLKLNSESKLSNPATPFGNKVVDQIEQYFESPSFLFDLPLRQIGTEHQIKVWKALSEIPRGAVLTYGELAKKIGSSARAIGNACRNNPHPIVVPCHRIVAASDVGGFSGSQSGELVDIKRSLLRHEGLGY